MEPYQTVSSPKNRQRLLKLVNKCRYPAWNHVSSPKNRQRLLKQRHGRNANNRFFPVSSPKNRQRLLKQCQW